MARGLIVRVMPRPKAGRGRERLLFIVALILCGAAVAHAQPKKEKIAVLGLEVVSQNAAGIDAESTRVATDLSVGLRVRPKSGQGLYAWTPNSERELIDEKLMNDCQNEDKGCMSAIAKNLGADWLLYGRIERKSQGNKSGYQISLRLLRTMTQSQATWTDFIPSDEASGTKLQDWARKGYKKITNETEAGMLLVRCNCERGTILVDGQERGSITSGRGEVAGLSEGKYVIAVVSPGHVKWEADGKIAIKNGENTIQDVTLKPVAGPIEGPAQLCDPAVSTCENTTGDNRRSGSMFWKGLMFSGLVIGAGGGGLWAYSFKQIRDVNADLCGKRSGCEGIESMAPNYEALVDKGNSAQTRSRIGAGLLAGGVVIAAVGFVKGYIATGGEKRAIGSPMAGRVRKRPTGFVVAPVIAPTVTGATLQLEW
jgi:hypothetical protein